MNKYISILVVSVFLLSGCAGVELINMQSDLQKEIQNTANLEKCRNECSVFKAATKENMRNPALFTGTGSESDLLMKLAEVNEFFIGSRKSDLPRTKLSLDEIETFIKAVSKTILNPWFYVYPEKFQEEWDLIGSEFIPAHMFQHYYTAYMEGKFVDRFGNKVGKPKVGANIGNDTITGVITVFFEAVLDYQLRTPLLYRMKDDQEVYVLAGEGKPTCAGFLYKEEPFLKKLQVKSNEECAVCGVTEGEAKAINYISNLAADMSAILGGLVVESFGGFEISLVVGGYFSVGDNQTLAVAAKKIIEIYSRRLTERLAFDFFCRHGYPGNEKGALPKVGPVKYEDKTHNFIKRFGQD